jgi:hypothetical protein
MLGYWQEETVTKSDLPQPFTTLIAFYKQDQFMKLIR